MTGLPFALSGAKSKQGCRITVSRTRAEQQGYSLT